MFSATVSEVTSLAAATDSSATDLAGAIGHDAGLTAKVLKLANSPLFCQQGRTARTIGSAVVLLGFDAVRDLAITLSIVNQAERVSSQAPLINALLQAFHCAGQARAIALRNAPDTPEEVFLAGLLATLGELVFWASGTNDAAELAQHWQGQAPAESVQREVLGFTLRELTAQLAQQWQLGTFLRAVVAADAGDARVAGVLLAREIASAGPPDCWQALTMDGLAADAELSALVTRHAELMSQSKAASLEQIALHADQAGQIARRFGVSASLAARMQKPAAPSEPAAAVNLVATDPTRQLAVLGDMAQAMQHPVTLDQLLQLALTGIVEGAGFDRVFFAILTPDRQQLTIKHRRGEFGALPKRLERERNSEVDQALQQRAALVLDAPWVLHGQPDWQSAEHSVLQPVQAGQTSIGFLYADRHLSGPQIGSDSLAALALFVQQVTLGLG